VEKIAEKNSVGVQQLEIKEHKHVIASTAKQSRNKKNLIDSILDCFVATLLAMTGLCGILRVRTFQFSNFN
jgi:hypothetical protein